MDRAKAAELSEGLALVHLGVGERMQGDRRVAGARGPAAQRGLLGHRAGGEEDGGREAELLGGTALQLGHRAVAVDVGERVQVVDLGAVREEGRQTFRHGVVDRLVRQGPRGAPEDGQAVLLGLFRGFLPRRSGGLGGGVGEGNRLGVWHGAMIAHTLWTTKGVSGAWA
ncbi:hypothetical protein SXANM310S_00193 [Streptomyces xanthochromogenes]